MKKRLLINDFMLIAAIIICLILLSFAIYMPSESDEVTVMYGNTVYGKYSLSNDITEAIGDSGVVIEIKSGKASVIKSDCSDGICKAGKPIEKNSGNGASLVCLPNKVAIIKGSSVTPKEADAVAG